MRLGPQRAPFGHWKSPLTPEQGADALRFSNVFWDSRDNSLVWWEGRSGKGALAWQSSSQEGPKDLVVEPEVRARVGYGGGDFTLSGGFVFYAAGGRLYRCDLQKGDPIALTPAWGQPSSPAVSPDGNQVIFVHAADGEDLIALVDTEGKYWPQKVATGCDFYMQPTWHPSGTRIAWICWNHPNMPWDGTALYLADLSLEGAQPTLEIAAAIAGSPSGKTAIFQPAFSPDGRYLSYISNQTGWPNLCFFDLNSENSEPAIQRKAEYGIPAWVQGLRTYVWTPDSKSLYLICHKDGFASLERFDLRDRKLTTIRGELEQYTALRQVAISPDGDQIALIASSSTQPESVIRVSPDEGKVVVVKASAPRSYDSGYLRTPRPLTWAISPTQLHVDSGTGNGSSPDPDDCHGLYYAPANLDFHDSGFPPTIIKIHGGPTSQFLAEFSYDTQFLTSRGYAVLELNYRGSSGYGRSYAEALKCQWGITDVEDARFAADYLIESHLADPSRLVVMGGSAGGYTVLLCLIRYPGFFKAGICLYGVSDLLALTQQTHKFEAHYLESLVGTLPENTDRYRERSPVSAADRIQDPLALFQGEEDQVVPPSQSDQIAESLSSRGVPLLYERYPGEGHGWRQPQTIAAYYRSLESFLSTYVAKT